MTTNKNKTTLAVACSVTDGKSRRTTLLTDGKNPDVEIFHECDRVMDWPDDPLLDGNVLSLLLLAMSRRQPLVVRGALSRQMMRNLEELQYFWSRSLPDLYGKIEITPDRVVDVAPKKNKKAISAFSGGADATFTALRHARTLKPDLRYPLTSVLMVHGFDVDLDKQPFFDALQRRVRPLLDDLGLELRTIRTNSKDWKRQPWDMSHGLELAACLHLFSDEFQYALIGSSNPYEAMVFPYGSNPVTDPFMSGDALTVVHDGCGYTRPGKVAEISRHPVACKTLKVCWAGEDQSGNCGRCEKCVRTMMSFLALGNPIPPCFPGGLHIGDIGKAKIYHPLALKEYEDLLAEAVQAKTQGAWMNSLRKRIKKGVSSYDTPLPRKLAGKALSAVGLKEPVKKFLKKRGRI